MEKKLGEKPPLWQIFFQFLRLGLTAFGGPAMVAYIRDLAVKKKGWVSEDAFRDGVALVQTIPGATAMQAAAYAGLRTAGLRGALCSYTGFALPAFLLMACLSAAYQKGQEIPTVLSVFSGLQVIVVAMVANATVNFGRKIIRRWQDWCLGIAAAAFLVSGGSPILAICVCGAAGMLLYRSGKQGESVWRPGAPAVITGLQIWLIILALAAVLLGLYLADKKAFDLVSLMLKIDLFAFGGGYASLPLMFHEVVEARGWMDSKTLMDGIALGQITPGPIVITAAFVGYYVMGFFGAFVGTVAIFTPSFLILVATVPYFDRFKGLPLFRAVMRGVLVSFVGLLLAVAVRFAMDIHWGPASALILVAAFAALRYNVEILWVVLCGGAVAAIVL